MRHQVGSTCRRGKEKEKRERREVGAAGESWAGPGPVAGLARVAAGFFCDKSFSPFSFLYFQN